MRLDVAHEQIPTWWRQPNFRAFRELMTGDPSLVLFVGSGLSVGAGLPNWRNLLFSLAHEYRARDEKAGSTLEDEVAAKLAAARLTAKDYKAAGSLIERAFLPRGEDALRNALSTLLHDVEPTPAHGAIARLPWTKIITTNYDMLLESAADAQAQLEASQEDPPRKLTAAELRERTPITSPTRANFIASQKPDRRYIVKIHGDINASGSKIVLSEKSFEAMYDEKSADYPKYAAVMSNLLTRGTVLFLGYSHDDEDVQELFKQATRYAPPGHVFALVPREGKPRDFAERLAQKPPNIQFITYSPDDRHAELQEFLGYFADPTREERYERLATRRRPSVVMLHCGGTIGARAAEVNPDDDSRLEVMKFRSRFDNDLAHFAEQLHHSYTSTYVAGDDIPIDLLWEVLPYDDQMFSENATPEIWNTLRQKIEDIIFKYFHGEAQLREAGALAPPESLGKLYDEEDAQWRITHGADSDLTERRFQEDFTQRYVLGVIILFGTDSLAFAASAMSLGIQHLPCPVIITGANQPASEDTGLLSRPDLYGDTDTWPNLTAALLFLQSFGHTVTEALVAFGNTIHNGINLRKRATEIIPSSRYGPSLRYTEPFSFRNLSQRGQYMFKLIDGVFCDNFYPNAVWASFSSYEDLLDRRDLRHLRFNATESVPKERTVGDKFTDCVVYAEISPCFPPLDVQQLLRAGVRAVLIEGYASGTFPSEGKNPFVQFLRDAYAHGLPVVLVARYGILATQQAYAIAAEFRGHSPVLPLYEIIVETALPLLSLAAGKVNEKEWDTWPTDGPGALIERRINCLRHELDALLGRPNILSDELKHVTNPKELLRSRGGSTNGSHHSSPALRVGATDAIIDSAELQHLLEHRPSSGEGIAILSRRDIIRMLSEFPRLFSRVQAGPDGLEQVGNIGYEVGGALWRSSIQRYDDAHLAMAQLDEAFRPGHLFQQTDDVQDARVQRVNGILELIGSVIDMAGIARSPLAAVTLRRRSTAPRRLGSFLLTVTCSRGQYTDYPQQAWNVRTMTENEQAFLRSLRNGCPVDTKIDAHRDKLRADHDDLLNTTWLQSSTTADWFLFGIYKGVACKVAEFLVIDDIALRAAKEQAPRLLRALRKRVKTRIIPTQQEWLRLHYEYVEGTGGPGSSLRIPLDARR
jgi:L-asparaginase/Glu-tRNA(Gln) amidotransferase subunit D/NAD-dependent SIR2 family protein deacetylase